MSIKTAERNAVIHSQLISIGYLVNRGSTVELVFEPSPAGQNHAFDLLAWQENLHNKEQEIISQHPECNSRVIESLDTLLRPSNFRFQLVDG